ncbi:EF-hand domain-containing protein [Asticcacaulis benevestitus]|uniref:EF-hand domain-containing protein n=1 Tax=Asticcacaulis benevestitus DSM 16100 = ATCC BAA-896 TaxID=1121022 RepID=V4PKT7_9CAUL|nr:EF-hand domain-containing protein [Asticcacaulis benevestitus]ESQ87879.1 hypothetical protein ABENE_16695 [Asticcacaulis benevestitus DSM 16100 = ATCC BAA-896]
MFKSASRIGLGLAAALCALPALAEGSDGKAPAGAEREGPKRPLFSDIDTNSDGVISQAEFDAFKAKRSEGHGHGHWGGHRGRHHMGPPDLKTLDTDGDGKVSFAEFSARSKALFGRLDTDHDGSLSAAELKARPPRGREGEDGPPPPPPEK